MDYTLLLPQVIAIAEEVGQLLRAGYGQLQQVTLKGAVDPVTETDTASETLILARLRAAFPDHYIHTEESGGDDWWAVDPVWLIDPLDGTVNFAHNFPHFCVSMGLLVEKRSVLGVIHDPLRGETFAASLGGGATLNGVPLRVSQTPRLAQSLLATGFPYTRRVIADNNTARLDHFLRRCQGARRAGSAALDLAYVAAGRLDGYWEMQLKPWDIAAGLLLVQEAGGQLSDFTGSADVWNNEIVASNGLIHVEMLQVLREGAAAPHPDWPLLDEA